jgi:hypothetical protein
LIPETTIDLATEANPNGKHAQSIIADAQLSVNLSPLERAQFTAIIALALLPTSIKSLALDFHLEFLALQRKIQRLAKTKHR